MFEKGVREENFQRNFTELITEPLYVTDEKSELKNTGVFVLNIINYLLSRLRTFDDESRHLILTPQAKLSSFRIRNIKVVLMSIICEEDDIKTLTLSAKLPIPIYRI